MKFRSLIIAVLVLLALVGVLYWSNHRKPSEPDTTASSTASPVILKMDSADISEITITRKGMPPVTLNKDDQHTWRISEPKPLNTDQEAVSSLLETVSSLNAERLIEQNVSDLKRYGFDQPAVTVAITARGHGTRKLLLGDQTPAGEDVYAMVEGQPKVYTIASYNKSSIDKGLGDLRDKRLVTIAPDRVSRIELRAKGQDIVFARIKDGWQIEKPKALRADGAAVDELVGSVCNARMDPGNPGNEQAAIEFAQATPKASIVVTGDQGPQGLEIRKHGDDYYAKSTAAEGVYKTDASLGSALDKGLDDFRNKKLFDFGFSDPNKIELEVGTRSWLLTRSGADWWLDGKKIEPTQMDSLVGKLRDLTATGFPDSGFGSPAFEATVTLDGGKRVEKVTISDSGSKAVAKRENEPVLYEVPANTISELTTAAEGLKSR